MITSLLSGGLLSAVTQAEGMLVTRTPGAIVGPIANFLGYIYNALFNFIYSFIQSNSLGIAIILFTLLVKLILTPLIFKQQKSTYKMQKLQPEMNRIKEKYAKKKDPESQQKMALELQEFQKKNGISLMGGCLPLLIQLPILYALFYIFQQAYLYVDVVGNNYNQIAQTILSIPIDTRMQVFSEFALKIADAIKAPVDLGIQADVVKVVNELNLNDWNTVLSQIGTYADQLKPLLDQKNQIEYFLGIHLVYKAGLGFPGILIPLLAGGSTWLSSRMMTKNQASMGPDDPTAGTMKMMNIMMPLMMGFMTITMPAGLGLYWTISNIFQMGQQVLLQGYFKSKDEREMKGAA